MEIWLRAAGGHKFLAHETVRFNQDVIVLRADVLEATRDSKIQSTHDYSAKQRDRSYAGLEAWVPCSWLTFASATAKFCIAYEASFAVSALYQTSAVKKVANTARLEAFNFDLQGLELRFFVMGNVQFKTTIAPEWCRDSSRLWDSRRGRECKGEKISRNGLNFGS
jgi:hypothetical protein